MPSTSIYPCIPSFSFGAAAYAKLRPFKELANYMRPPPAWLIDCLRPVPNVVLLIFTPYIYLSMSSNLRLAPPLLIPLLVVCLATKSLAHVYRKASPCKNGTCHPLSPGLPPKSSCTRTMHAPEREREAIHFLIIYITLQNAQDGAGSTAPSSTCLSAPCSSSALLTTITSVHPPTFAAFFLPPRPSPTNDPPA